MNNEIKFTEWVAESHFHLYNIEGGIYYWKDELSTLTTQQLYNLWIKDKR